MTNLLWPGDHRAGEHMTDRALLQSMVAMESAWLGALAEADLAPADCAHADLSHLVNPNDCELIACTAEDGGNPIIGLVELLRQRSVPAIAPWIHRGLTGQDVLDTSLMLAVRAVAEAVIAQLTQQISALSALARAHRATPMVARTLTQYAAPTTFGAKAARWLNGVTDAGDPAAVSDRLVQSTATALGLDVRPPWHTTRTPVTTAADALLGCSDCWGHIASDVVTLGRPEIAELSEPATEKRGGSSSMPHKRNPVLSILIRRAAMSAPQLAATLHTAAALANDERPDGSWHAEWDTLRTLARRTVVAGSQCVELLAGLQVHSMQMAENLGTADVLGEQREIAELAGKPASPTYLGAVDRLIDWSLARAERLLADRS